MDDLFKFLLNSISKEEIKFEKKEDLNTITYTIKPRKENAGLVIGKNGKTIKAITQILKIKAVMEKKRVFANVEPSEQV